MEQVTKTYRRQPILQNITLQIAEPKIVGLVGRNGAGKSTLMKLLAGHYKPSKGRVLVARENPFTSLVSAANTIFIDEHVAFPNYFTLADILQQGQTFYPNWQQQLAQNLLSYVGLEQKRYYKFLSTGQRATFNLIYGLAARCAITLLDEPMNGMDEAIRSDMYRAILKEYIAYPRLIILSSHYLVEIEHLIEELIVIDEGQLLFHESVEDFQQRVVKVRGEKAHVLSAVQQEAIVAELVDGPFYEVAVYREGVYGDVARETLPLRDVYKYVTAKTTGGIDHVFK